MSQSARGVATVLSSARYEFTRYRREKQLLSTSKAVVAKHAGFVSSTAGGMPFDKQRSGKTSYRALRALSRLLITEYFFGGLTL
jgi:hypothetical protein